MTRATFLLCLVLAAPGLRAQTPPDTTDDSEAQQLRRELRRRWNQRVRQELDLTEEQAGKLQGSEDRYLQRRREIAQRQRAVNEGLRRQLQPGVAANADSVRKLMDARDRNRTALAQLDRDEDQEISGYLTPVQHARYQMMREQLRHRIEQIREQRRARGQMVGPRGRPRPAKPRRRP